MRVKRFRMERLVPYLLLSPALFLLFFLFIFPIFWNFYLSLHDVTLVRLWKEWHFIGLENYTGLFNDDLFLKSLRVSLYFVGGSIGGQFLLGLSLALLLNRKIKGVEGFRVLITVSWIVSNLVVAYTWVWMYDSYGLVNRVLSGVGMSRVNWLGDPDIAIWAIVLTNIWFGVPFTMLTLGSALKTITPQLYEAAAMDGAGAWRSFRSITFPLLKPFIAINMILITMWTVNLFALQLAMTKGGPLYSTTTTSLYMYKRAFEFGDLSVGSTIGVLLFLFNVTAAYIYTRAFGR
jgi:ABC-type sugar transport system permease subunit